MLGVYEIKDTPKGISRIIVRVELACFILFEAMFESALEVRTLRPQQHPMSRQLKFLRTEINFYICVSRRVEKAASDQNVFEGDRAPTHVLNK